MIKQATGNRAIRRVMQLALQDRRKLPVLGAEVGPDVIPPQLVADRLKVLWNLKRRSRDLTKGFKTVQPQRILDDLKKSRAGRNQLRQIHDPTKDRSILGQYIAARNVRIPIDRLPVDPGNMVYRAAKSHQPASDLFFSAFPRAAADYTGHYRGQSKLSFLSRYRKHRFDQFPRIQDGRQDLSDINRPFYTHHVSSPVPEIRLGRLMESPSRSVLQRLLDNFRRSKDPDRPFKVNRHPSGNLDYSVGYETVLSPKSTPKAKWMIDGDHLVPVKLNHSPVRRKFSDKEYTRTRLSDDYRNSNYTGKLSLNEVNAKTNSKKG